MKENIIDTFRCTNNEILYKDLHIDRVVNSFNFFHFLVDVKKILKLYDQIEIQTPNDRRVRVEFTVKSDFKTEITTSAFQAMPSPVKLTPALFGQQLSGEGIGNLKTTDRSYWEKNLRTLPEEALDCDILGLNDQMMVTETSRFNLFVFDGQQFFTPSLESGCLRGVFREHCFLDDGIMYQDFKYPLLEKNFSLDELKNYQIFVGNSLQGLLPARLS